LNATQAAIRAGYSKKTAKEIGYEHLTKPHIQQLIHGLMQERNKRSEINSDDVLNRLVEIDQMDILDILNDDCSLKPISLWPEAWRRTLSGMDVLTVGKDDTETVLKKIKWPDKVKNLEMIGKHVNVQAWNDKKEITGPGGAQIEIPQIIFTPVGPDYVPSKD